MKGETSASGSQTEDERAANRERLARRAALLRERQEALELRARLHPRRTHLDRIRWLARAATFRRT